MPNERRYLNLSTKEDRQPRNRLSLLFEPSDETIRHLYGITSKENYNVIPSGSRRSEKVEVKNVLWNKDLRLLIL